MPVSNTSPIQGNHSETIRLMDCVMLLGWVGGKDAVENSLWLSGTKLRRVRVAVAPVAYGDWAAEFAVRGH